jgi:hypothetical protein
MYDKGEMSVDNETKVIAQNIVDFKLLVLWSMDIFFLTTKGLMLLCRLKVQIKAGDLPQRKCPIH